VYIVVSSFNLVKHQLIITFPLLTKLSVKRFDFFSCEPGNRWFPSS